MEVGVTREGFGSETPSYGDWQRLQTTLMHSLLECGEDEEPRQRLGDTARVE